MLILVLVLAPASGRADERVDHLSRQLAESKDARVRAQAALLLATTGHPDAVAPLCKGLADTAPLVRVSVMKGLGATRHPDAQACLNRMRPDPIASVEQARQRALEAVSRKPTLYMVLREVQNQSPQDLDAKTLGAIDDRIREALVEMGASLAPPGVGKQAAAALLEKSGMTGYMLSVVVQKLPGDALYVRLLVATYPQLKMLGEVNIKASGAPPEVLIKGLAPALLQNASRQFGWSPG